MFKPFSSIHGLLSRNTFNLFQSPHFSILVYSNALWDQFAGKSSLKFFISTNQNVILLVGAAGDICVSPLEAELRAILFALEHYRSNGWSPCKLLSECHCAIQLINDFNNVIALRFFDTIQAIKNITHRWPDFSCTLIATSILLLTVLHIMAV